MLKSIYLLAHRGKKRNGAMAILNAQKRLLFLVPSPGKRRGGRPRESLGRGAWFL